MKYLYLLLGSLCVVALLVLFFQNNGVAINSSMTGLFFANIQTTDGLIIPFTLFSLGAGIFLTLGIKGIADGTFDNSDSGFGSL